MWNWVDTFTCKYPGKLSVSFCILDFGTIAASVLLFVIDCQSSSLEKKEEKKHMACFSDLAGMWVCASGYSCLHMCYQYALLLTCFPTYCLLNTC